MPAKMPSQRPISPGDHAIVTGDSSGIGRAIALQLARQGVHVSLIARRPELLQEAQQAIRQAIQQDIQQDTSSPEPKILTFSTDVSDRAQAEAAIAEAIAQSGPPRYLITSAGIAYPDYFQDIPIDIFEQTMAINYFGTLYCIRAALPAMEAQGAGQLCIISSGAGLIGLYGYSAYGPSKFALRGLAETLRGELKPCGIGVAIAYPPDTDTPQYIAENRTKPPATKEITATAKLWEPEQVAHTILTGLAKNKFEITPGLEITILNRFHSLISPLLNQYFDSIVAKHPRS